MAMDIHVRKRRRKEASIGKEASGGKEVSTGKRRQKEASVGHSTLGKRRQKEASKGRHSSQGKAASTGERGVSGKQASWRKEASRGGKRRQERGCRKGVSGKRRQTGGKETLWGRGERGVRKRRRPVQDSRPHNAGSLYKYTYPRGYPREVKISNFGGL